MHNIRGLFDPLSELSFTSVGLVHTEWQHPAHSVYQYASLASEKLKMCTISEEVK